eukprot:5248762-Pleurochrysis_carterae.AAC.4
MSGHARIGSLRARVRGDGTERTSGRARASLRTVEPIRPRSRLSGALCRVSGWRRQLGARQASTGAAAAGRAQLIPHACPSDAESASLSLLRRSSAAFGVRATH